MCIRSVAMGALTALGLSACVSPGPPSLRPSPEMEALGIPVCAPPQTSVPERRPKPKGTAFYAPKAPRYPYPADPAERADLQAHVDCLSNALSAYIRAWHAGQAPAELPEALIPWGTHRKDFKTFTLRDPATMPVEDQWVVRPAHDIDENALYGAFQDPNATYLVVPAMLAPFGSTLVIEGAFPHARYFSAQATPPFDLDIYRYDLGIGVGEVPIVDADIIPLPGHTNPFQVGADRKATRRGYRLEFEMAMGDPVALNPAFRPPHFREPGNRRKAAGLVYEGPWGHPRGDGHKRGLFAPGQLWLRYYAPDWANGPLAGVPLPRLSFTLDTGERFFIEADVTGIKARSERRMAIGRDDRAAPEEVKFMTDAYGWNKQAGIFEAIVGGIVLGTKGGDRAYVNDMVRGVAGRGDDQPAPGNYEQSATSATHIDYLVRGMNLERDRVVVLTGKLPTFPDTRIGADRMAAAQMRYWSITGYHVPRGFDFLKALFSDDPQGLASQSIMDDEVVLDQNRHYAIVFSRDNERPRNATEANGVNWVDWGASAEISWTLRWLSVGPEWKADFAPTPQHIGSRADYWSPDFDREALFQNTHTGALGPYLPKMRYLSREEFEAMGADVGRRLRADIPVETAGP